MATEVRFHRVLTVLLTAALLATLTVALTGGQRAEAVDGPVEVVYVATGRNFPDALAGANLAATVGAPLLTVEPDLPLPPTTVSALQSLDPDRIIVLGGPAAVSDAVVGALTSHARSGSVTRIEGADRHDTAAAIADALPDRVHDADLLDGLDATDLGRVDARRRAGTAGVDVTGQAVAVSLPVAAPRDGYLLVTAQVYLHDPDEAHDMLAALTLDTPGPLDATSFGDAAGLALVRAPNGASNATGPANVTTTVPVTAGDHTLQLHVVSGAVNGTFQHRFAAVNAVFVPFGTVSDVS